MKKAIVLGALFALVALAAPAMAQDGAAATAGGSTFWIFPGDTAGAWFGAAIGTGLIVIGAARAIGRIGGSAVESIARQPEAGGQIFQSMLLSAALIEGFTLFGVVVTLLIALKA